jgi:hypothetical protein
MSLAYVGTSAAIERPEDRNFASTALHVIRSEYTLTTIHHGGNGN